MRREWNQPQSPEDIVRVLAPLSEPVLQSVIEEKSKAMDIVWLKVMAEERLLSMEDIEIWSGLPVSDIEDVLVAWGERVDAFLGFLSAGELVAQRQSFSGRPDVAHQMAICKAPDDFKTWFDSAAATVMEEHRKKTEGFPGSIGDEARNAMVETFARWTMAASMLDRPHVVKDLLAIDDRIAECTLPLSELGPQMVSMAMPNTELAITPVFVAVQFSSPACIDALLPMCKDHLRPLLGTSRGHKSTMQDVRAGQFPKTKLLHWGANLGQPFFVPMCDMDTHAKMCRIALQSDAERGDLMEGAFRAMRGDYRDKGHHYLPAFKSTGVFDLKPLEYASKACVAGYAFVIKGLTGIEWDKFSDVTILNAARAHVPEEPKGHSEAICALIDQAIADGHGAKAMAMTKGFNSKSMEPIQEIVSKNMEAVLIKYLDNGLSATEPLVEGGASLIELCNSRNPAMLNVIRSHGARRTAHSLIDEIMQTTQSNAPGP